VSRILIWSPNYAPELTGIPPLVTDAAEWLAARGHVVDVVAPMPNYPRRRIQADYRGRVWMSERRGGVGIHRAWLRVRPEEGFVDKALYELTAATMTLPLVLRRLRKTDVLLCVVPTLLAATYATILPRRLRVVLWVQDLVVAGAGALRLGGAARRAVAASALLERRAAQHADRVVVCSSGFRDHFMARGVHAESIDVVHNWVDLDWIEPKAEHADGGDLRVLYAGNLGYSQGLATLVDAARIAGDGVRVDIVGDGNAARVVASLAAHVPNVHLRGPVPRSEFPDLLGDHDAHIVIQRRVSAGANLPSKIATALASGRPIVASIDPDTPAASLLRDSGGAILVEPESPIALAQAMRDLAGDPERRAALGRSGRAYAEEHLSKESALRRLETAILP
jgi:colanic acid biosynthesis glycosyl transferase WcaI